MTMNKILILLFLIITLSVKSQSIDKVIVDKTIEYIGDCVQHSEQKKILRYKYIELNKIKFYSNFDEFDSIIKYDFENTYKTFTSPLIEIKKESNSQYDFFIGKISNKKDEKFDKYFVREIIKVFNQKLVDKTRETNSQIKELNKPEYSLFLIIIILSVVLIYFILKKQKKIVIKQKKVEPDSIYINQLESENIKLKEQVVNFNLKIKELESKLQDLDGKIPPPPPPPPPSSKIKFYLLGPIADKTFSDEHKSSVSEYGNSMFLFTILDKETHATFEFCGDTRVLSYVMDFPDESIERVCEYENLKTDFKSEIITTKLGEAELRGDKWIVTKPAKIKFQ